MFCELTNSVFFTNLYTKNNIKNTGIGKYVVTNVAESNVPTAQGRVLVSMTSPSNEGN